MAAFLPTKSEFFWTPIKPRDFRSSNSYPVIKESIMLASSNVEIEARKEIF